MITEGDVLLTASFSIHVGHPESSVRMSNAASRVFRFTIEPHLHLHAQPNAAEWLSGKVSAYLHPRRTGQVLEREAGELIRHHRVWRLSKPMTPPEVMYVSGKCQPHTALAFGA